MTPERWQRIQQVFAEVCDRAGEERAHYLDQACAGDLDLRREVQALLAADAHAESCLVDHPIAGRERLFASPEPGRGSSQATGAGPLGFGVSVLRSLGPDGESGTGLRLPAIEGGPALPSLAPGAEKYHVLGVLGEGAGGTVYLAFDQDLKRQVALKVMHASAAPDAVRRFLEEAQALGQLQHPGILPVHEVGRTGDGSLYYTMPVVRGRSLAEVIAGLKEDADREAWSFARRATVWLRVAAAVAYAQARGVIHRDLEPGSVMLGAHGEVQVLDWGLSLLLRRSAPAADATVDEGALIWALGALFYELLTLRRPFAVGASEMLSAGGHEEVVAPRSIDPAIPLELERACIRSLARSPGDRWRTVADMAAAVTAWLEASVDQALRHERAEALVAEARQLVATRHAHGEDARRLDREAGALRASIPAWMPIAEKAHLLALEQRADAARQAEIATVADLLSTLEGAIAFEEDHPAARELIADHYWEQFRDAEQNQDPERLEFLRRRVTDYHDGKYTRELQGDGSLTLTSEPPGARVTVLELVEEGFVLVERNQRDLGTTPLGATTLPMGSYVVVLQLDGYRDVRYPVHITRNRDWVGHVRLYTDSELGDGMILIPGGPFVFGGDSASPGALPRAEPELADFAIARFHVTVGEYLEFLNDTARRDGLEVARACAPRDSNEPSSCWLVEDGVGGLRLPDWRHEGNRWLPDHPVDDIAYRDAVAYLAWRSRRDGREYRLATELEWEKAARGVDGRIYPWGNRFDPSLYNGNLSRPEGPVKLCVDSYPCDCSVYGVRGLAGNVKDMTSSGVWEGAGEHRRLAYVARGSHFRGGALACRIGLRFWTPEVVVWKPAVGFRLARSLP